MTIRILTKEDAQAYQQLRHKAVKEEPIAFAALYEEEEDRDLQFYEAHLSNPLACTYGLYEENTLIGIATVQQESYIKMQHIGNIVSVYIDSNYQGKGYSKTLMLNIIEQSKEHPVLEQLRLSVVKANIPAVKLYEKVGFTILTDDPKVMKLPDGSYVDEYQMILFL